MSNQDEIDKLFEEYAGDAGLRPETKRCYRLGVNSFADYLEGAGIPFLLAQRADVQDWIEVLSSALSASTVRQFCSGVSMFYAWLQTQGVCLNPVQSISRPQARNKRLALDAWETRKVLEALRDNAKGAKGDVAAKRDYLTVCLLLRCGLRMEEVLEADVCDVVFGDNEAVLTTKGWGKRPRNAPVLLDPATTFALHDYLASRLDVEPDQPLVASLARTNPGGRLSRRSITNILTSALSVVGRRSGEVSLTKTAIDLAYSEGASEGECREFARTLSWNTAIETARESDRKRGAIHERISRVLDDPDVGGRSVVLKARMLKDMAKAFRDDDDVVICISQDGAISVGLVSSC